MFIRQKSKRMNGTQYQYWELVESFRTEKGPRQKIGAHLGLLPDAQRKGMLNAAK